MAIVVALVLTFADPNRRAFDGLVIFVEHGDELSLFSGFLENTQSAFANESSTAFAGSDEFDDPKTAPFFDGRDFEFAFEAELRSVLVFVGFYDIGDEAIEVDISADLVSKIAVIVEGVDFENLDNELGDVLKVNGKNDFVVDLINLFGGCIEFDIDAVLKGLELGRRKE